MRDCAKLVKKAMTMRDFRSITKPLAMCTLALNLISLQACQKPKAPEPNPSAVQPKPDLQKLKADTIQKAQVQIDALYGSGRILVSDAELAARADNHYDANLTLSLDATRIIIPASVTADATNLIVQIDAVKMKALVESSRLSLVKDLEGIYSYDILKAKYRALYPRDLLRDYKRFSQRMDVGSPVTVTDRYIFGSACQAHSCTFDEAAFVIDRKTGDMAAAVLQTKFEGTDGSQAKRSFRYYGLAKNDVPAPLKQWAAEIDPEGPQYQE